MHDDTDILTGAELLAEIGLDPHAIRDILGDDETRIGHCPGWDMPAHHCVGETQHPFQRALADQME